MYGQQKLKPIKSVSGTINTTGDTSILAALTGTQRRVIQGFQIQSEGDAINTVLLKSGSTVKYRFTTPATPQIVGPFFFPENYGWIMGNAEALILNLSAAKAINYTIWYFDDAE